MSARPIHGVAFLYCWFTLNCCCEEIWSKRIRVFEDDVFIENMRLVSGSKTQDLNLRADLVLKMSRGPPGQWFPEIEYWAFAIFVGTSGIPPKIIYRSVKSDMPPPQIDKYWKYFSICSLTWRQNLRDCWLIGRECKCIFLAWEFALFLAFLVSTRWNFGAVLYVEQQVRSV